MIEEDDLETKDVILTEELKAKLKASGMIGFQVGDVFTYVPKFFRDVNNCIPKALWPVYRLKSKNGLELAESEDGAGYMSLEGKDKRLVFESGKQRIESLVSGIVSVKNQPMEDGSFISYDAKTSDMTIRKADGEVSVKNNTGIKNFIKLLPVNLQIELQNAILERSQLTPDELLGLE
jgi:hypothetical protein